MPANPQMRASDDDRDRAASLLREHHAAGRLTIEEFQERLDAAYRAKTLGEIDKLMADLPAIDLYHLPEQSMRRMAHAAHEGPRDSASSLVRTTARSRLIAARIAPTCRSFMPAKIARAVASSRRSMIGAASSGRMP